MPTPNRPASQNKYTEQNMGNTSFDEDFGVNAVEIVGHDTDANVLRRIKVDSSGQVATTASLSGDITASTEYTEDAAAAANPVGGALIMVREDARAGSLTTADGDNVAARGTNAGELYVKHVDAVPVTDNSGSLTVDVGTAIPAGNNNIGDMDIASLPNEGQQTMANSISVAIASNQSAVAVDGSGVTQPVSNAGLTELAAAINSSKVDVNIASSDVASGGTSAADDADFTATTTPGTPAMGVYESTPTAVTDGDLGTVGITSGRRLKTSATIDAALPAGTAAIGKLAANSGVDIGDVTLTANDGVDIGNVDVASIAAGNNNIGDVDVATIAAGDNNIGNVDLASAIPAGTAAIGKLLPPDIDVTAHTNYAKKYYTNAGAVTDGIVWSPAAGKRFHVTSLFVNVSAAATVTFEDDKAGGDEAILKMELAANSGTVIPFPGMYPLASGEDAADLIVTTSAGNVYITVVGYEI